MTGLSPILSAIALTQRWCLCASVGVSLHAPGKETVASRLGVGYTTGAGMAQTGILGQSLYVDAVRPRRLALVSRIPK